ncbi:MAG: glycosyltransferase family 2 protein [Phycisphaerae bacterium]
MTQPANPQISVLMPAYNAQQYLRPAVESILNQTFADFEFIIIDDGSTDHTARIITSYADPRIRFYQQANQGLSRTLNRGIGLARGTFIARQDADDVSMPGRFAAQIEFTKSHADIAMVGTAAEIWVEDRPGGRYHRHPCDPTLLAFAMLFDNYFVHSSVMIRRAVLEEIGGYSAEKSRQPEDFELWSRISRKYPVANLPDVLQIYRERRGSICRTDNFEDSCTQIAAENIALTLGLKEPAPIHLTLASYMRGQRPQDCAIPLGAMKNLLVETAGSISRRFGSSASEVSAALALRMEMLEHQYARFHPRYRIGAYLRRRISRAAERLRL